ncbi:MAG: D-aminoacyl-tRNA deacylase [Clostridiales bacterium]|nr:D-aminoacyl-tRNA deacylase [Clostridiales bacterium]
MIVCIQRVERARVTVDGKEKGAIEKGLAILLGIRTGDGIPEADWLAKKCAGIRIFEDEAGKLNLSVADVGGKALVVTNFTLCGSCVKGRRPSFDGAERPEKARPLAERFVETLRGEGIGVETGEFGADMKFELVNDGPVTVLIDTADAGNSIKRQ